MINYKQLRLHLLKVYSCNVEIVTLLLAKHSVIINQDKDTIEHIAQQITRIENIKRRDDYGPTESK